MPEPSFDEYFNKHIEYIKSVQVLLATPIEDLPGLADHQAREVEAHGARMNSILAWANGFLDIAEAASIKAMPPRDRQFTDLDRETKLAADVVKERRFRDVVEGLCKSIDRRVSYVQSMLRHARLENQVMQ